MTVRPERPQSLGRGLAALIPQRPSGQPGTVDIALDRIRPNPHQPRQHFDEAELATLTASVREHGVLQPVLVAETVEGYQLVAGERRLRAARAAGLERIPAIVRQLTEQAQLEIALVENLQREDLDPIEAARGFRRLIDEFGFTLEEIAARVGRARSTVANTLRLLDLAPIVQDAVIRRTISEGHARQLLALNDEAAQAHLLKLIIDEGWSVRKAEQYVVGFKKGGEKKTAAAIKKTLDETPYTKKISKRLEADVKINATTKGGQLIIGYKSDEDLERISSLLLS